MKNNWSFFYFTLRKILFGLNCLQNVKSHYKKDK